MDYVFIIIAFASCNGSRRIFCLQSFNYDSIRICLYLDHKKNNKMKTYLIEYACFDNQNKSIKSGKMKIHRCANEFEAKVKTEKYFSQKLDGFKRLEIYKCRPEDFLDQMFDGILNNKMFM